MDVRGKTSARLRVIQRMDRGGAAHVGSAPGTRRARMLRRCHTACARIPPVQVHRRQRVATRPREAAPARPKRTPQQLGVPQKAGQHRGGVHAAAHGAATWHAARSGGSRSCRGAGGRDGLAVRPTGGSRRSRRSRRRRGLPDAAATWVSRPKLLPRAPSATRGGAGTDQAKDHRVPVQKHGIRAAARKWEGDGARHNAAGEARAARAARPRREWCAALGRKRWSLRRRHGRLRLYTRHAPPEDVRGGDGRRAERCRDGPTHHCGVAHDAPKRCRKRRAGTRRAAQGARICAAEQRRVVASATWCRTATTHRRSAG
mmetsp:Transcript_15636/g.39597  ORF Transcript_15636/g.39597 Transcript_15636/m.39597 type:complete len:316 (-) Transcript_15636:144-1091(-)